MIKNNNINKFKIVREYLNNNFEYYIQEWFPNSYKASNDCYKTGNFDDKQVKNKTDGSLVFNLNEKYAKDFSTGETAGDIISIYAKRYCNGDNGKALKELIDRYNLKNLFNDYNTKTNNNTNITISDNNGNSINTSLEELNEINKKIENCKTHINYKLDQEKDNKINEILNNIQPYQKGDTVDLYLKKRNITKYSPDTYILKLQKSICMVNIAYKINKLTEKEKRETNQQYRKTSQVAGIQQIFLNQDGTKKENNGNFNNKIQRAYSNSGISGNPVILTPKGKNNGYIFITEGIENGLSIQEHINNEVWCALSISNIATLPFEDNKIYIFIFDNDYGKIHLQKYSEDIRVKLEQLNINYNIKLITEQDNNKEGTEENNIVKYLEYDIGEYNHKTLLNKLKNLDNKHFFYLIPDKNKYKGYDSNDLLKENKLKELLEQPYIPIESEQIIRQNVRQKTKTTWRPQRPFDINENDNDNFNREFAEKQLTYDSKGLAERFYIRYKDKYVFNPEIGFCQYENGKYVKGKEREVYTDIERTLALTYFEYDYLLNETLKKDFLKLWKYKGVGENKTIKSVYDYINSKPNLNVDIDKFDNENDNIINVANGYIDLENGKLNPHTKNKYFLKKLDTEYKETLNTKNINNDWNKFLLSTFCNNVEGSYLNDKKGLEKIRFLQKAIGYTFSTSIAEEKLFIIKGVTRSGKNTFLDTIQEIMKDYCGDTQDEEFITSREQNNNYLLGVRADLKGKRFLHISEISKSKKLNGAQIKRLVGNRRITAKYLHHNSFSYQQQCKYWLATNNIDFNEFDESIKSKLFIIDFNKQFYQEGTEEAIKTGRVIDKKLKEKLLKKENREFILKWIIDGYQLYKMEGLKPTEEMQEALSNIEEENDNIGMFFKDSMSEFNEEQESIYGVRKDMHQIYDAYVNYETNEFETREEQIISFRKFMKQIRSRGFEIRKRLLDGNNKQKNYITDWCLKGETILNKNNFNGRK